MEMEKEPRAMSYRPIFRGEKLPSCKRLHFLTYIHIINWLTKKKKRGREREREREREKKDTKQQQKNDRVKTHEIQLYQNEHAFHRTKAALPLDFRCFTCFANP